jgi:predicted RNA-binding protein (virulence factor B family)
LKSSGSGKNEKADKLETTDIQAMKEGDKIWIFIFPDEDQRQKSVTGMPTRH